MTLQEIEKELHEIEWEETFLDEVDLSFYKNHKIEYTMVVKGVYKGRLYGLCPKKRCV